MSDMKCPFCQQELLLSSYRDDGYQMWNCLSCQLCAQGKLWRELIRTRKALEIAVNALKSADEYYICCVKDKTLRDNAGVVAFGMDNTIAKVLEQITALEQKGE